MNKAVLEAKQSVVKEIVEKANNSSTIVVAEYRGLTVAQLQELRRALRKEEAELCVYKNSLVERAGEELGYQGWNEILAGPNAIIFSKEVSNGATAPRGSRSTSSSPTPLRPSGRAPGPTPPWTTSLGCTPTKAS